ncbi:MAG: AraC family transcriptional regulator [Erysipelotrichaceae bacterium]|nr:AraC family transcriptional regulator [Erysipelotrichaceae bacterium]
MKKSFTNSKVQRNIIVSYIITGLILTGILSLTYSYLLTNQIIDARYKQADSALQVATSSTTLLLEEVYARYFQLFQTDPQLILYKEGQLDITLQSYIGNLAFNDVLVDSILLVDVANQTMVDSLSRTTRLSESPDLGIMNMLDDLALANSAIRNLIFYPRTTAIDQQEKKYLTLTFASRTVGGALDKVMFVNLDAQLLSKLLYYESDTSYMIIVNRFGQIISDSSNQYFNDNYFDSENEVSKNLGIDVNNAYIARVQEVKSIVVYQQTSKFNLTFFSISNYQQITGEVTKSNWIVMVLFGFFLALTGVLSLVLSKRIYSPIQRLVYQIAQMNHLNPDFQVDEFEFIYKALDDISQRKVSDELRNVFAGKKTDNSNTDWTDAQIIVLQPRLVDLNQSQNLKTSEHIWELFKPNITLIDEYTLAAFASMEQIESYEQWNNDTWIAGISHPVEKSDQINKCFKQAKVACEFAFTKDDVKVQYYSTIVSNESSEPRLQIKNQLHSYIVENFHDSQMSIDSLAQALGYSIGYVRQIFKEEMGVPYNEYLIVARIDEAKRLLEQTELSAKEIGDRIGISDTRYFYTVFKNRIGMTAQEYRKKKREETVETSE